MSDKIFQTSTALPAPRVSVVLPLFNAGEHFRACIDSLVAQAQTDFEVIVVADAPSDGSLKLARDYALQDERIRVIENQTNMHIGMSRNIGLQAVRAPFVVFVDHDDICNPLMLSCLLEKQVESDADVVFGLVDTTVVGDPTNGMLFPTIDSSEYSGYDMSSAESRRLFALHDILSAGGSAAAESLLKTI
ncbi:MAG: glycosyltransferase, partial [Paludibacteraceae bacterium]|nr:glycosyltransferase [Paludibacteraceae bacterium]